MTEHAPTRPELHPGPDGGIQILVAVNAVMTDLEAVGKDAKHAQAFNYRAADAVVDAVGPLFAKHGVIGPIPAVQAAPDRHSWETVTNAGKVRTDALTSYTVVYTLLSMEDGSSLTGQVVTLGQGLTAYAPGAAMSYALKYFLSAALLIPFHDPKMELDSAEYRAEAEDSRATRPDWWQHDGWASEEAHSERRQRLIQAMKDLPDEHMRSAKRRFAQLVSDDGTALWVPARAGRIDEKGQMAAQISMAVMVLAEEWFADIEESAVREGSGVEPFNDSKVEPQAAESEPGDDDDAVVFINAAAVEKARKKAKKSLGQVFRALNDYLVTLEADPIATLDDLVVDQSAAQWVLDWLERKPWLDQ